GRRARTLRSAGVTQWGASSVKSGTAGRGTMTRKSSISVRLVAVAILLASLFGLAGTVQAQNAANTTKGGHNLNLVYHGGPRDYQFCQGPFNLRGQLGDLSVPSSRRNNLDRLHQKPRRLSVLPH